MLQVGVHYGHVATLRGLEPKLYCATETVPTVTARPVSQADWDRRRRRGPGHYGGRPVVAVVDEDDLRRQAVKRRT
jgi:hypothetical protein